MRSLEGTMNKDKILETLQAYDCLEKRAIEIAMLIFEGKIKEGWCYPYGVDLTYGLHLVRDNPEQAMVCLTFQEHEEGCESLEYFPLRYLWSKEWVAEWEADERAPEIATQEEEQAELRQEIEAVTDALEVFDATKDAERQQLVSTLKDLQSRLEDSHGQD